MGGGHLLYVFGNLNNGTANYGLSYGNANNGLTNANWNIVSRPFRSVIKKICIK